MSDSSTFNDLIEECTLANEALVNAQRSKRKAFTRIISAAFCLDPEQCAKNYVEIIYNSQNMEQAVAIANKFDKTLRLKPDNFQNSVLAEIRKIADSHKDNQQYFSFYDKIMAIFEILRVRLSLNLKHVEVDYSDKTRANYLSLANTLSQLLERESIQRPQVVDSLFKDHDSRVIASLFNDLIQEMPNNEYLLALLTENFGRRMHKLFTMYQPRFEIIHCLDDIIGVYYSEGSISLAKKNRLESVLHLIRHKLDMITWPD